MASSKVYMVLLSGPPTAPRLCLARGAETNANNDGKKFSILGIETLSVMANTQLQPWSRGGSM